MKLIYNQPYTKHRAISCWYGKPPRTVFRHDVIKLRLPANQCTKCGDYLYITPDEAADIIRALSAGLHHYLVDTNKEIIKAKRQTEKEIDYDLP